MGALKLTVKATIAWHALRGMALCIFPRGKPDFNDPGKERGRLRDYPL
jgi:hypothetical protein